MHRVKAAPSCSRVTHITCKGDREAERWWVGRGEERRGWGMKGIPGDEVLKSSPLLTVTGNRHTGAGTCCYQFFCSPVRQWEEAEKEGSDKERGRERRRNRVREKGRWEGVCVCVSVGERQRA